MCCLVKVSFPHWLRPSVTVIQLWKGQYCCVSSPKISQTPKSQPDLSQYQICFKWFLRMRVPVCHVCYGYPTLTNNAEFQFVTYRFSLQNKLYSCSINYIDFYTKSRCYGDTAHVKYYTFIKNNKSPSRNTGAMCTGEFNGDRERFIAIIGAVADSYEIGPVV